MFFIYVYSCNRGEIDNDREERGQIYGGSKTGGIDEKIQTDVVMQTGCQYVLDRNSEFQKHGEIGEVETPENRIW